MHSPRRGVSGAIAGSPSRRSAAGLCRTAPSSHPRPGAIIDRKRSTRTQCAGAAPRAGGQKTGFRNTRLMSWTGLCLALLPFLPLQLDHGIPRPDFARLLGREQRLREYADDFAQNDQTWLKPCSARPTSNFKHRTWPAGSGSTLAVPLVSATSGRPRHGNSGIIRSIFW